MVQPRSAAALAALGLLSASLLASPAGALRPLGPDGDALILEVSALVLVTVVGAGVTLGDAISDLLTSTAARVRGLPGLTAPLVNGAAIMVMNLGGAVDGLARLLAVTAGFAAAEGSGASQELNDDLDTTLEEVQGLLERRTAGLLAAEAAVLEPLPAAVGEVFVALPGVGVSISVVIPGEGPTPSELLADPTQLLELEATDVVAAVGDLAAEAPSIPGEVVVITDDYVSGSAAALTGEAGAALADATATAGAVAGALLP